jgi:hypothetical protein
MEEAAPLIENSGEWVCSLDCRVGSAACAQAVGMIGSNPGDMQTLNDATSTILDYNNCEGPIRIAGQAEKICALTNSPIEPVEAWV